MPGYKSLLYVTSNCPLSKRQGTVIVFLLCRRIAFFIGQCIFMQRCRFESTLFSNAPRNGTIIKSYQIAVIPILFKLKWVIDDLSKMSNGVNVKTFSSNAGLKKLPSQSEIGCLYRFSYMDWNVNWQHCLIKEMCGCYCGRSVLSIWL